MISAARGKIYDAAGNIIGHHDKRRRYECVVRFIFIYLYGGTRHVNILLLTWFQDAILGHINVEQSFIERQGPSADITNKRKGTSPLIGSLIELALRWAAEDEAMREKVPGKYVHIIHDEDGNSLVVLEEDKKGGKKHKKSNRMQKLFNEVRQLAGLPHVRPHMLKHSGVTFAVRAGMPLAEVELSFSTSVWTLWTCYVHLKPQLVGKRSFLRTYAVERGDGMRCPP
ncbi:site-specific integrase [Bradyrhizobium huanghuaihaiense]